MEEHPRPGKTHDFPDPFLLLRRIAVDLAVAAEGLLLHEGTDIAPMEGIVPKFLALGTEFLLLGMVLLVAGEADHLLNDFLLALALFFDVHGDRIGDGKGGSQPLSANLLIVANKF